MTTTTTSTNTATAVTCGKVYVAAMNMRGTWAPKPPSARTLNVTSAQHKTSKNRRDFSPMSHGEHGYKGYWCFENYWQAAKVYDNTVYIQERKAQLAWWKAQTKPHRRYPGSKAHFVVHADFGDGVKLAYIDSRKQVYVPEYYAMMHATESLQEWRSVVDKGGDVVVYDFDGPRLADGKPTCVELSLDVLKQKINDATHPFGHGYIVAATLMHLTPDQYCM